MGDPQVRIRGCSEQPTGRLAIRTPVLLVGEVDIITGCSSITITTLCLTDGSLGQLTGENEALAYEVGILLECIGVKENYMLYRIGSLWLIAFRIF